MRISAQSLIFTLTSHGAFAHIQAESATFQPNPKAGGGGAIFKDSARFRVYNCSEPGARQALNLHESAYTCMVSELGWRSSGLSFSLSTIAADGPYYKMNAYCVPSPQAISGASSVMSSDRAGHSFVKIVPASVGQPQVTVHEYGHTLTYYEKTWVQQTRTGTWWEPLANYVADVFLTSPFCAAARTGYNVPEAKSTIDLNAVLGHSYQVMVDGTRGTEDGELLSVVAYFCVYHV